MKRAGVTQKISISVNEADLKILKKRAKRLHGGNVSAVFVEMTTWAKQQEARAAVLAALGGEPITEQEREAVRREWRGEAAPKAVRRSPRKSV
jgi:hypothetical protein